MSDYFRDSISAVPSDVELRYFDYCEKRKEEGLYRSLETQLSSECIDFSSNDYLGLSRDVRVIAAGCESAHRWGAGATGSRLLSGNRAIFQELEKQVALDKGTEAALTFNSGYQANSTALAALLDATVLGRSPLVFCDRLNHASLYQAILSTKAELVRYRHLDLGHLEVLLKKNAHDLRPKFIVTETIFGMDGDGLDCQALVSLARKFGAFVYLDEAHAIGLVGRRGYGVSTLCDWTGVSYAFMGTFSKAVGAGGGYIASSVAVCNYLINRCAGFIYSTAPSPMVAGAALKGWKLIAEYESERRRLFEKATWLRSELQKLRLSTGTSSTPIISAVVKENQAALSLRKYLARENILVSAIRPPTVPRGSARVRIALQAGHTDEQIDRLIAAIRKHGGGE